MGEMADLFGDYGPEDLDPEPATCKFCGRDDLEWIETVKSDGSPGWALFTPSGRRHACNRVAKPSEFEVLDAPANPFSDLA